MINCHSISKQLVSLLIVLTTLLLVACGGGSSSEEPTLVTTTCTPAPALPSAYSRVFKGCDAAGVAQYYELTECVRDNATGLIWQGHMPSGSGHLRASDRVFNNYDALGQPQIFGSSTPITTEHINDANNSIGFKNAVNATNLCGSQSWRLPTRDELAGLVKSTESPKIDIAMFPHTNASNYVTSTPHELTGVAWFVNFGTGLNAAAVRSTSVAGGGGHVRLVR